MIFVLMGMPGSGKTRKGRELAALFNVDFFDLDKLIEEKYNHQISEIIQENGLDAFRKIEEQILSELLESKKADMIISLGGGTVTIPGLLAKIKKTANLVYLDADINVLHSRLIGGIKRPLFLDENQAPLPENRLRQELLKLFHQRKEYYQEADIRIKVPCKTEEIYQRLLEFI